MLGDIVAFVFHDHLSSGTDVSCQAAWFDCAYKFRSSYRFVFERAVMEYTGGLLTVYHQDGRVETPAAVSSAFQDEMVPVTNAYYNEIRYFTDCVLAGKPCDKVREEELIAVLDIIDRGLGSKTKKDSSAAQS